MTKKEDRESRPNRHAQASQSPAISNSNESVCKSKFSYEEDEQIIEYVKQNDVLYNIRHPLYRDKPYKKHLWEKLSKSLNRNKRKQEKTGGRYYWDSKHSTERTVQDSHHTFTGIDCMRRWMSMRDYFKRMLERRPIHLRTNHSCMTDIDKRNASMSFLLEFHKKRSKKSSQNYHHQTEPEPEIQSVADQYNESIADSEDPLKLEKYLTDEERSENSFRNDDRLVYSKTSSSRKRKDRSPSPYNNQSSRRVREYQPTEYQNEMISLQKRDHIDTFLMAIADSLRNLPSVKLAETKLKITQIVGEAELEIEKARATAVAVKSLQNFYMSEMDVTDTSGGFTPENNEADAEES